MIEEIWKNIEEFDGYQISNFGNVKSFRYRNKNNPKILKKIIDKDGYYVINLYRNKKCIQKRIHILVANAFISNLKKLPQVNHKDENKLNNKVDNLEWCTAKYNCNYGTRNQRISKKINQYDLEENYVKTWDSIIDVEKKLNIFHSRIIECCQGKRKSIGGYKWRYYNEI